MKEIKEFYPGVNGETFLIRIVHTGMSIVAETCLVYDDGAEQKLANLRNDRYENTVDIDTILQETKSRIDLITIIKSETGIDNFKKE